MENQEREVWQRGPVAGVPPLLQPVAHALLQAQEEIEREMLDYPEQLLWEKPGGLASIGFHLQHLTGVLDRLFTYALAQPLTEAQRQNLTAEGQPNPELRIQELVVTFGSQVVKAISQLKATDETILLEPRALGRAQIPTNVLGLLFHSAEHTMRHVGQLLVTARILKIGSLPQTP
ncbi:DinB family protein [Nibribacter ruber]|uniref:DinB family protein n=1 Tax=Nibribacter ruber TaxID=2698458 RepID=A0A6P1NXY9_9BACT|nr:DinB family protein [Nibribacter ruber]QHL86561.1 DinB family protein [Nibribacter ruber]